MRCLVSPIRVSAYRRRSSPVRPYLPKIKRVAAICRPVETTVLIRLIDNLALFREGVRTQIKRAYELSVCLKDGAFTARLSHRRVCQAD